MDEKQLKIMLMFGTDAGKAHAELEKLQGRFEKLRLRASELKKNLDVFQITGKDASKLQHELQAVESEMQSVAEAARKANAELQGMSQTTEDIRDNLFNLRDIGEKLQRAGTTISSIGRGILNPIMQAAQLFLTTAEETDPLVKQWKDAMSDVQNSWQRIGRVAVEELLPLLKDAGRLAEKLADFIEQNPELIKVAVGAGAALIAAGKILETAGAIAMLVNALKGLGLAGTAAGGAAGGAAMLMGGSILGGVGLGLAGYETLAQSQWGKQQGMANLGQYASVAAYSAGKLFSEDTARRWFLWMGQMTGVIEKQADAAQRNTQQQEAMISDEQLAAFSDYETAVQQRKNYERSAEEERTAIVEAFGKQRTQIEQTYESQRNSLIAQYAEQRERLMHDFAQFESRAEQDYYWNRSQAAQSYRIEIQRAEEDHQRRMRRLRAEHEERVEDLVARRDALGLAREQRSYERQRREEEEEYRVQAARRSEDFARQIQEMEAQFALQRQRRLEDYQQQLQDLEEQRQEQLAQLDVQRREELRKLEEQKRERLRQFDKQYQAELQQLRTAEQNRLNILRSLALGDQAALQKAGMELTERFKAWLDQQVKSFNPQSPPKRALGGPVSAWQTYLVGEQGPELFTPAVSGLILPHSMTRNVLGGTSQSGPVIQMQVETSSLTLNQVLREVEKLLYRRDQELLRSLEA